MIVYARYIFISDEYGLWSPAIQKTFQAKSAASIVARVFLDPRHDRDRKILLILKVLTTHALREKNKCAVFFCGVPSHLRAPKKVVFFSEKTKCYVPYPATKTHGLHTVGMHRKLFLKIFIEFRRILGIRSPQSFRISFSAKMGYLLS